VPPSQLDRFEIGQQVQLAALKLFATLYQHAEATLDVPNCSVHSNIMPNINA
jgi:hypothetical protein